MATSERDFIRWLAAQKQQTGGRLLLGIGDDMACVDIAADSRLLVTTDMLLDGTHFSVAEHDLERVGRKAIGCSLSDCAAMASLPIAATASVALPRKMSQADAQRLAEGMLRMGEGFKCPLIGGDTVSWDGGLAIDVTMFAVPAPGIPPVRRDGARPGDGIYVTGALGGSILGKHLVFTPRVHEAQLIARTLGPGLHAMMDITDGLSIDLDRMCEASGVGACLNEVAVLAAADPAAHEVAQADNRSVLHHVLTDGEDFELLIAAHMDDHLAEELTLRRVGTIEAEPGLRLRLENGRVQEQEPQGYEHL